MRIFLFLLVVICTNGFLFGQQSAYFLFGEKEFEGVDIYDVIQDNSNNYWFATDQGLIKHDGYTFENIECEEMKGNSVFGFVKSNDGTIYCHNLNHQVFSIKNSKCSLFFEIPDKGVDISLITTEDNKLLLNTSGELYYVDGKNTKQLVIDRHKSYISPPFKLSANRIIFHYLNTDKIIEWDNHNLTIKKLTLKKSNYSFEKMALKFIAYNGRKYAINSVDNSVFLLNEKTYELAFQSIIPASSPLLLRIYSLENSLWIANNISGVAVINTDLKHTKTPIESYTNYFISDVFKDNEGNILLSTFDNGVLVIPDEQVLDVDNNFKKYSITRLFSLENDALYFGTHNGQLLSFNNKIKTLSIKGSKKIETLFKWNEQPFVFSDKSGFTITNINTEQSENLLGSLKDLASISKNQLIVAINTGVHFLNFDDITKEFSIDTSLILGRSYNVCYEKPSKLIYASTSQGLFSITTSKKIKAITFKKDVINALSLCSVGEKTYISSRKQGMLIFSNGKLIEQFHPKLNDQPLTIYKMVIYENKIYANTQIGLVIMNIRGQVLKFLNKSSCLSTNKIIDFAIFKNELWVTHSKGIQHFSLNKINHKVAIPDLHLSSVFVNSKSTSLSKNQFSSDARKFKFIFKVKTLKNRENIRYHYKLEGNNDNWHVNLYYDNEVTYNALAPGKYRFIVKAENNGIFSLPKTYSFNISAPFYQRWWFNLSIGISLLILITLIYKRQLKIQKNKADQLNELNASRLTAIQSQMNPHFIFNSLNSIQDLVLKGDIDNSYTFITKFSNLVRRTLNYSDKDFIDFEQEIKLIELYLSLEKLRFKEDLIYSIDTTDIDDILIPPMLIQPFIENALVHGLLHKEGVKQLTIKFILEEVLICEITDNGIGREKALEIKNRQRANHESFAVNAIKRRFNILKVHFKGELGFVIEDVIVEDKVEGTKVTLRIPVKNKF